MNNYLTIVIAFFIGQFSYTTITVYNLQRGKDISFWSAYVAYMKKETGWFVVAIAGLCCLLFILSDFLDLSLKKSDLINKETLSYKEKIVVYFRTIALCAGAFIQHIIFAVYNKGKKEIEKVNDKINSAG
mgnify:CR=1 FL=1